MTSPENILIHLSSEQERQVRNLFAELEVRGFPKQHQTPHITITFSPEMDQSVVKRAAEILPSVIPAQFRRVGTVIFGTKRKQTVCWLLETSDELEIAARELCALNPQGRGPRWTPHLTMGLRLPRELVPEYIRALDEIASPHFTVLTAQRAVYWKPSTREMRILADGIVGQSG
ncbi:2'-5' RNA ligase family protein [Corynebacterium anserum]|uniref:2'-5' RNA ligase n=1 Tax=Corynebacterium anserum TaxID=2684406 RepID=A0A7G7YPB8_9CORY|nr:2'-5' RNA ligase family protein [Corynebacterium anserum]MBC2681950.1 2'-5' RNA ligase [Corynebacterium anserum]QNH96338.1 2'-5' RNA ligase [Corynebacterium anserum]